MKPTEKELEILRFYAQMTGTEDKYVWLREDDKGRYIEYAFKEGAPHDNRCLSWYEKPHPKYFERHPNSTQGPIKNIDELYELYEYACGLQDEEGDRHCSAGHPAEVCRESWAHKWTYEEPVKCACWALGKIDMPTTVSILIEKAMAIKSTDYERD